MEHTVVISTKKLENHVEQPGFIRNAKGLNEAT
jgi:hypothetical protein